MHSLRLNVKHNVILFAVRGFEALSQLFYFDLDIDAIEGELEETEWLHHCFSFQIHEHIFHGEVIGFAHLSSGVYQLRVMPSIFHLQQSKRSRIYHHKTALDIIKNVLKMYVVDYSLLTKSYALRAYCVQYQEDDWAFVERLMAEEGIRYYFVFNSQKHTLVLTDQVATQMYDSALYHASEREDGYLIEWNFHYKQSLNCFSSSDYSAKSPQQSLQLSCYLDGFNDSNFEKTIYPGGYEYYAQGERLLHYHAESYLQNANFVSARSRYQKLQPNSLVYLAKQPASLYLLVAIWHTAEDLSYRNLQTVKAAFYHNSFRAIPGCLFRASIPNKTLIADAQIAQISPHESYKPAIAAEAELPLNFAWDEAQIALPARVAQPGSGLQFFPRSGDKVVVYFVNGDPERPIIFGALNDRDQPPLYDLPTSGIRSNNSQKFNELKFNAQPGQAAQTWHAARDLVLEVERDASLNAQNLSMTIAEGSASLKASESYEIKAQEFIQFRVGNSFIKLTPEKIILRSHLIRLN